jgi:hypothetical protein
MRAAILLAREAKSRFRLFACSALERNTRRSTTVVHRKAIVALATRSRLPAAYSQREFTNEGGLISCGVDTPDLYRRAASYVDRIQRRHVASGWKYDRLYPHSNPQ